MNSLQTRIIKMCVRQGNWVKVEQELFNNIIVFVVPLVYLVLGCLQ